MIDEEIKKMLKELRDMRKSNKSKDTTAIPGYESVNYQFISMDFASLYPSTMTMKFPSNQSVRKKKIKKIFDI